MEWIEEDLQKLAAIVPKAKTIQLLSANPQGMTCGKLAPIFEMINRYLPKMEYICAALGHEIRNGDMSCLLRSERTKGLCRAAIRRGYDPYKKAESQILIRDSAFL